MNDYDFGAITDKEFEVFCTDLVSAQDGVRYERFKPGRDSGIDGRFFQPDGGEVILQCKHWARSPLERLVKYLEAVELPKIAKLDPPRYRLAISHSLSRNDKAKIAEALAPYIKSASDILGREDLNDLLAKHPDVERRHYKLWIGSTTVLQYLLNKALLDRSRFALEEILRNAPLYVATRNHKAAIDKLNALGSVIITGPAGIGKTTLADHVALHYVRGDFQFVHIAEEINEAESVFQDGQKQVFYFDDFLGRNYLEALSGHEGAHIVQFIQRVAKDRTKRFILTSRSTILNQGKLLNDVFQNNNLERNEFELSIDSLSEMDRARILYNHIWHSSLPPESIEAIYEGRRYREIVRHRNYNPRLIRFITDGDRMSEVPSSQYWKRILELLENPAAVWENPFEAQLDDFGRAAVLLVTLDGRSISESALAEAYARFFSLPNRHGSQGRRDFLLTLKHLCGSLLSRTLSAGSRSQISLFNPSIGDYVLRRYAGDVPSLRDGFASHRSVASLRTLKALSENGLISQASFGGILRDLLGVARDAAFVGYSADYVANACLLLCSSTSSSADASLLSDCALLILDAAPDVDAEKGADLVRLLYRRGVVTDVQAKAFLESACHGIASSDDLAAVWHLSSVLSELDEALTTKLQDASLEYLEMNVVEEFPASDVFDSIGPGDLERAEENLRTMISDRLSDLGMTPSAAAIERIVCSYGVDDRLMRYWESQEPMDEPRYVEPSDTRLDEIDDLFEREE